MKRKMFVSFILTLLLGPLANSSCDADDDCKVGTSVGSGVCQVGAAVGGVAGIAKCVGGARFTFANASCGVAAPLYGAVGAGCAGAGEVVGSACNLCASDDAPEFKEIAFWYIQEIAGKVDGIEQTRALVENHLKQEAWFQQLFENDKNILLGQAKMIVLQQIGMGQLGQLIHATKNLENELELSHDVRIVREKFDFLKRGPSGLIVNDISAEFFRDAALRHNTRSYDSITKIFGMLIGGHKEGSIYETLGDSYCKPEIHKYFVDVLVEALTMYATAMAMEGHTLSPRLTKKFNEDLVKATSAYTRHCDCAAGYRKANRGQVSTILDRLPSSSQKLTQNRRLVARMENNVMRIKMDLLFAVKNFEPNKIAETMLESHSVEDIELVVASVMNKTEDELEYHDSADICVDEERNKVKTCAAFTPDSLVNGCVPPQTLEHGRFLCLEDGVTCHVMCDEGYDQRLPQTFMKCLDNAWTPLPTSFKCEVSCPYQDDLDSVILEHKWRSQLQLAELSEDDQRNTVIVEVEKMTGHTIEDLQGRANSGDLGSLTAIANMAALLIKYSIRSSSDVKTMTYEPHLRNTLIVETSKCLPSIQGIQGMTDHQLLKTFCTACTVPLLSEDPPQLFGSALPNYEDRLLKGQKLLGGEFLRSQNGVYNLVMQSDGNLVIYGNFGRTATYSTGTSSGAGSYLVFQVDGNLVIYKEDGTVLWATHTPSADSLVMQNDGNLVLYAADNAVWASKVPEGSDRLLKGQKLLGEEFLSSQNGEYDLVMQSDGNLVIYENNGRSATYSSGTSSGAGSYLVFQADGNLVMYKEDGTVLWATNTLSADTLVMQNDGNLVLYAADNALWASHDGASA